MMNAIRVNSSLLFGLVLVGLTGCAQALEPEPSAEPSPSVVVAEPEPYVIALTVDAAMDPVDMAAVVSAADDWNAVAGDCFQVELRVADAAAGGWLTIRTVTASSMMADCMPANAPANSFVSGCANPSGIRLLAGNKFQRRVAAHELGHLFGLPHTESGLMAENENTPGAPTLHDATLACEAMGLAGR